MYIDEEPRLVRTGWLHKKGAVGKMLLVSCTAVHMLPSTSNCNNCNS